MFTYSLTAFGGPLGHLGMMIKTFAHKRHDVTEEELIEYNSFCQMLPGPSSTQTIMLIGFKRGGVPLAVLTLLLWILPASIIMGAFAFLLAYLDTEQLQNQFFYYVLPMSIGFVAYAGNRMMKKSVQHPATAAVMTMAFVATVMIHSPWVFPIVLIIAGIFSNFSKKRINVVSSQKKPIRWRSLWSFFAFFILVGFISELSRIEDWDYRRIFNLAENFYRFGSIVFGGGQALLPMMLHQFVSFPLMMDREPWLTAEQLITGYGFVQALPGPVFSICSFVGGMAMKNFGPGWQIIGSIVATIAVFLPSTFLIFFLFPIYSNLKKHVIIYRAIEGINAAIVGIIFASGVVMFQAIGFSIESLFVALVTFLVLNFTKIPAPFIVFFWIIMGWLVH